MQTKLKTMWLSGSFPFLLLTDQLGLQQNAKTAQIKEGVL